MSACPKLLRNFQKDSPKHSSCFTAMILHTQQTSQALSSRILKYFYSSIEHIIQIWHSTVSERFFWKNQNCSNMLIKKVIRQIGTNRILQIETNKRYRTYKESARGACLKNLISQPSLEIYPIMGSLYQQRGQQFSWVGPICFQREC